jgi:hypothetical protein
VPSQSGSVKSSNDRQVWRTRKNSPPDIDEMSEPLQPAQITQILDENAHIEDRPISALIE